MPLSQQELFQLSQYLRSLPQSQPRQPMSYQEWAAANGVPLQQQEQQQAGGGLQDLLGKVGEKAVSKVADSKGSSLLDDLFKGSGGAAANSATTAGSGLAADAGANAAYNAAAMEASGAPMTLAEPSLAASSASPGLFSLGGIGGAGNAILPAAGLVGAYDVLAHNRGPARGGLEGAASGAAIGSWFGPQGALIGAGIGGLGGLVKGLFHHKTTREVAKEHTKDLLNKFPDDPTYQAYVRGMREQYNSAPPDPSKPFHGGQYATWDEYKKAGLDAGDLTGVKGNLDLGPEYTNLNLDQQKAVTQAFINNNLYKSKKGEVEVTDKNKARQIFNDIAQGGFKIPQAALPAGQVNTMPVGNPIPLQVNGPTPTATPVGINLKSAPSMPAPIMIPRSKTRSPGIDLNGNRINYARR